MGTQFHGMKIRNLALLVAGGLLTAYALGCRRKAAIPGAARGVEKSEHDALQEILERSVAYNDALYERVRALEEVSDAEKRPAVVQEITLQNQDGRAAIETLRSALQERLSVQNRTFADIDGFAELISKYRKVSLVQQKRHLQVFEHVRAMTNVPASPELHAYLKLGFREESQKQADTVAQLRALVAGQREIISCARALLAVVTDKESAADMPDKLLQLGNQYKESVELIRLYRDDDPQSAVTPLKELKAMYEECTPALRQEVTRLRGVDFYDNELLGTVLSRLLP